ncbi:AAA domain-containing protein [Oribacterium sp. KHPX15]|uniref:AAA domain-containing protein n=1 Tax=Oribacterium sp. KHPX15 TaxID=1855342 RepID=UPI000B89B229|nr:AAA domain-containing protein [Oribacterium sp. KHPX15]
MIDNQSNIDAKKLIGMQVRNTTTFSTGRIEYIKDGIMAVDHHGEIRKYLFPDAFAGILELEDEEIHETMRSHGVGASFEWFKNTYKAAILSEINYLKATGGKKYRIVDGERISTKNDEYLYAFDTDTDLHFPDGTGIKLWFPEKIILGYIISCEDFSIVLRTKEYLGETIEIVEFTADQWQLLESLMERMDEMDPDENSLAYEIACNGKSQISLGQRIRSGQNYALNRATSERITFIWGPPGTGKTETLARIALEHIERGRRVLMLSYSNVSVDGALLRIAKITDIRDGRIIRYGYPRVKELLDSKTLTSYQYVLYKDSVRAKEYEDLIAQKKKIKGKTLEKVEINKKINKIRDQLLLEEMMLIQSSDFVATTVSKAIVDKAIYSQKFDVVIFDEASMAYVPQIIFSAGLAKDYFVCLGDFCQLPAIVQNPANDRLMNDIFDHTGITSAVQNNQNHEWLVMLDTQFRMHHDIADFVSINMYQGLLKTSDKITESRAEIAECLPSPGSAMSMVDLSGMYSVCTRTMDGSRINILSALMCMRIAERNISKYEVGIITPYSAQSRLILSMIRDMQEIDERWLKVTCATVHQFQGSEKPVIIYDAVDCFRMPFPGILLTSLKNDTANRLFNVAMTRSKGKFILVANNDYLSRKHISKKLMFSKAMSLIEKQKHITGGFEILDEMMPSDNEEPSVYIEDRESSWKKYIEDLKNAQKKIHIDMPDVIGENDKAIKELIQVLVQKKSEDVEICIRIPEDIDLPKGLQVYIKNHEYVTNPVTLIDKKTLWFGQPLYAADFISEGEILDTEYFPCVRFTGSHTARSAQAFLEL